MTSSHFSASASGLLCLGVSHRSAGVEVRERYTVRNTQLADVLDQLRALPGVSEAVIVSTCNRVEFYLDTVNPSSTESAAQDFLHTRAKASGDESVENPPSDPLYCYREEQVADHLFRVASGLDSMIIGESEILGQLKRAYAAALEHGATGRALNRLFQHAFRVAKELRSSTDIARGSISVGSVAVDLAEQTVGSLEGKQVMILGAGETSELTARALCSRGVHSVIVSNRSFDRAEALAQAFSAEAIHFSDWPERFAGVDILIASTSAPCAVVTMERLAPVFAARNGRALLMIDLAVPRDIEPAVAELPGVRLCDIDSLQSLAAAGMERRRAAMQACEPLLREALARLPLRGTLAG